MMRRFLKNSSIGIVVLGCVGIALPLFAASEPLVWRTRLSETAVQKGVTLQPFGDFFKLGVWGEIFQEPARAKIEWNPLQTVAFPSGTRQMSDIYGYALLTESPYPTLAKPVALSFEVYRTTEYRTRLHYLDTLHGKWQSVPSSWDRNRRFLRTALPFPAARVVALEYPGIVDVPVRVSWDTAPTIHAHAAIVLDAETKKVLYEKNKDAVLPLASLTKIATAYLALTEDANMQNTLSMVSSDQVGGATLNVNPGENLSVRDLFFATLVGSKNNAARALSRSTGKSYADFIASMNAWVASLGLSHTHFSDPTGLNNHNVSTAHEYALVSAEALRDMRMLVATTTKNYTAHTINTGRTISIQTTNKLLRSPLRITGGKTGYLPASDGGIGSSLMIKARDAAGHNIIAVILGEPSAEQTAAEMQALVEWTFRVYQFPSS